MSSCHSSPSPAASMLEAGFPSNGQAKVDPSSPRGAEAISPLEDSGAIALVGHPNVGKSALFQHLTGLHVTVSNYPGTTIEVTHGPSQTLEGAEIVDTPGVVTLPSSTTDEQATVRLLLNGSLKALIQVGDAKNLHRSLLLTVILAEMEIPMVLALNMVDEAQSRGIQLITDPLVARIHAPVVKTVAVRGEGLEDLHGAVRRAPAPHLHLQYADEIESAVAEISPHLPPAGISPRSLALLWLSNDPAVDDFLAQVCDRATYLHLIEHRDGLQLAFGEPLPLVIQRTRLDFVEQLAAGVVLDSGRPWSDFSSRLGRLATHPFWGIPILLLVLFTMYWFVGVFGAGTLVDLLERWLFRGVINPPLVSWVQSVSPLPILSDLLVGEYGLWTMGMTYAVALILPIVTTFFLAFSLMEDSGYLPRLAAFTNRLFRLIGLNGKAVLPMVLGLGCVTMATMTSRIMETKRDRLMVILLLALAVPCSAQLGIVMGMLASVSFVATAIWALVVLGVLLLIGWLAARVLPGERTSLLLELPPLRWPAISNVLAKTTARIEWYLKEVVPLFLLGALIMFIMDKTGALNWLIRAAEPLVSGWLGLPAQASAAFILGFLRRDFGATGLFVMESQGLLSPRQTLVAMVTITLFIPCIASVLMMAKERGWRTSLAVMALVMPLAFLTGGLLNLALLGVGW
jgi:ferrous iron transport protein B